MRALRSGEYKQTYGSLCDESGFCALWVGLEVVSRDDWTAFRQSSSLRLMALPSPQLLVVTQESLYKLPVPGQSSPRIVDSSDWSRGLRALFASLTDKQTRTVILGNIPIMAHSGPQCLAAHRSDVQACSTPVATAVGFTNAVEETTARAMGISYIDTIPWVCSSVCTAVIGRYNVYLDVVHISATFATYLEVVLGQALDLNVAQPSN